MAFVNRIWQNASLLDVCRGIAARYDVVRWASKKSSGSTRNRVSKGKPKHRGCKVQDGEYVTAGTRLVLQLKPIFHPGLHVGFGRDGTLFALESGKVMVTCEKLDPFWGHTWVERHYGHRVGQTIYKKFFNVIPEKQHCRFKLIDEV